MSFVLKIVAGPNRGAEVALVDGVAVTLGKGDECDIMLVDPALPDVPLKIETSAEGVVLDGELLEPLHVKTFGDTSFAVGPADKPWGNLVWPSTVTVVEETPAEPAPVAEKAPVAAKEPAPKEKSHGCLVSFIVLLLLAGIFAGLGWYFRGWLMPRVEPYRPQAEAAWKWTKDHSKLAYRWCYDRYHSLVCKTEDIEAEPEPDAAEVIAEIALRYGLDITDVDGHLALTGNLKTRAERLSATAEAYAALPCVELSLSDDETLKTAVEDTLSLIGETGLRVAAVTNRVAVLDGKCANFPSIVQQISNEVPKIEKIDGRAIKTDLGVSVAEKGTGPVKPSAPAKITPSLPVCGILTTPYPCLVTRSGARIMEGAAIGEWTISKIDADSVLLESSTGRFVWRP